MTRSSKLAEHRKAGQNHFIHRHVRHLACDIDGVLYPYMEKMRTEISRLTKRELPPATTYNLQDCWGIEPEVWHEAHLIIFSSADNHATDPIAGSAEELHLLADAGVQINYVTRRADFTEQLGGSFQSAQAITYEWIKKHFPMQDGAKVHCLNNKVLYPDRRAVMIDDNATEAEALRNDGRKVVILDQPYNQHYDGYRHTWGGDTLRKRLNLHKSHLAKSDA